jgi:predicted secreted protein
MGKKLGNDYLPWVPNIAGDTFNIVKGNTTLSRTRSASTIDTSSKEDFPYSTQGSGSRTVSISAAFRPNLPDADGFARLETLANGDEPFMLQIRKGGVAGADPADVVFEGLVNVTDFSDSFGQNAVVEATCTFVIAEKPLIDKLL